MKTLLYGFALLAAFNACSTAFGAERPRVCPVPLVSEAPALDGKTNDAAWTKAFPMDNFVVLGDSQSAAVNQTVFRAVHTADALFLAIECREPRMDRLQTVTQKIHRADSVEIFVQPEAGGPYWQIVANADGAREEYRNTDKQPNTPSREIRAYRASDSYGMELKLPFDTFGKRPAPNAEWRFNIARNATLPGADQLSTWSPLPGSFHDTDNFGSLVFFDAGTDRAAINRAMFKRRYAALAAEITAYEKMYRKYDDVFYNYAVKFIAATGWEDLRGKAERLEQLSPDEFMRTEQELEKIAGRLPELELARNKMLKQRIFRH
ncbi:MAG: sugar-binding protein [Kiritimatiellae bacterium]|jgi:hypothetical protein|nr:sugar-binding protein [Kiritimatiellia bacterium]